MIRVMGDLIAAFVYNVMSVECEYCTSSAALLCTLLGATVYTVRRYFVLCQPLLCALLGATVHTVRRHCVLGGPGEWH